MKNPQNIPEEAIFWSGKTMDYGGSGKGMIACVCVDERIGKAQASPHGAGMPGTPTGVGICG